MAGVVWSGVRKDYGAVPALRAIDLEAADGELLVVVGPSGSGKTTLLRITAGLELPSAGSIAIGGRDVTRRPPGRRNVAMVFQSYALFPHLTAAENIGIGLEAREVPRDERRRRVAEAARVVGCEQLLDRRPHELSGGERQRVALARALVRDPDVSLLDEPLSNLDAQLRIQMRAELKELHREVGATMVYVTHDQVEALTLGDRIVVLNEGAIQQVGVPADVFWRPENTFVARFIGSPPMNLFPATVDGSVLAAGPLRVALPTGTAVPARSRLEAGVRPEHVRIGDVEGPAAEVHLVEPAGAEVYVRLRVDAHEVVARMPAGTEPQLGSRVRVAVAADALHLFDAETGKRIEWMS
jgi:ABC-type sugar transport system ATPase subunit